MVDLNIKGGEIFAIPLFIPYDTDMQRFSRKFHKEQNGQYAFCRIISDEQGGGYLIEVFSEVGGLDSNMEEIIQSPRLFRPLSITGLGIYKKRWLEVYKQENYGKEKDSKYSDIKLVMGGSKDLKLWQNREYKPITEEEAKNYEKFIVWRASHLERRIREALSIDEPQAGDNN